jgi:uncharacterized protein (TIGR03067 family)
MRKHALLLVAAGLLIAADKAKDEAAKKDSLLGSWTVQSFMQGGQKVDDAEGDKVTFEKGKVQVKGKNGDHSGAYTLRANKSPRQIDFTPDDGEAAGKLHKGIYELKGDSLKVLLAGPDEDRPKDFKNKEGAGVIYVVLKRDKV